MDEGRRSLERLDAACSATLGATFANGWGASIATSYAFVTELELWRGALARRPELVLLEAAQSEYLICALNAVQGQYRNAFKGLRLVLELLLQAVLLSTDILALREWLASSRDTSWSAIKGPDGVFSARFARAFYPPLATRVDPFRCDAEQVYRALSECIHGGVPSRIPLPQAIAFDEPALQLWTDKAKAVRRIIHFALTLRYLMELDDAGVRRLEPTLTDVLGDLAEVRTIFGGRVE